MCIKWLLLSRMPKKKMKKINIHKPFIARLRLSFILYSWFYKRWWYFIRFAYATESTTCFQCFPFFHFVSFVRFKNREAFYFGSFFNVHNSNNLNHSCRQLVIPFHMFILLVKHWTISYITSERKECKQIKRKHEYK